MSLSPSRHTASLSYVCVSDDYQRTQCVFDCCLRLTRRAVGFSPEQPVRRHVPLSQRVLDKSYDERVAGMSEGTSKHGRLERHMAKKQVR